MKPITEEQRQALIADCNEQIEIIKNLIRSGLYTEGNYNLESQLLRQEIALASLTAEAVGVVNRGSASDNNEFLDAKVDCVHPQAGWENFQNGFKLYTSPPVTVIKFPDEHSFDAWFKAI